MNCARIVIAGTMSGVGKTSIALALVKSLRRRGLRVQTFKVGPDFLDPTYLTAASARPCYNLDGWMCGLDYVRQLFQRKIDDADFAVIEGAMGLFDGVAADSLEGSTAEIALTLAAPVVLITGAHGVARSFAATVKGFASFEPDLRLGGVIANHCGSDSQAALLEKSLACASLPPLLGAIPREALPALPSRHLGLVTASQQNLSGPTLDALADVLERQVKMDELIRLARAAAPWQHFPAAEGQAVPPAENANVTIAIARDDAFHFYYPDNLEALQQAGAQLVYFSPLSDRQLPEAVDAVYLGGGYPEEYAAALAGNTAMLEELRGFVARGGALYAECGGLMYLAQGIETGDGACYPLAGILPFWTRMGARRRALGYVEATLRRTSFWGEPGQVLRGHEFHYSEIVNPPVLPGSAARLSSPKSRVLRPGESDGWSAAYELRSRRDAVTRLEGFQRGRLLASYAHLHFAARAEAARAFVQFARLRQSATPRRVRGGPKSFTEESLTVGKSLKEVTA